VQCSVSFGVGWQGEEVMAGSVVRVYEIGEKYRSSSLSRKGVSVVRSAIYQGGEEPMVYTSEPCCLGVRRIRLADLMHQGGGWRVQCNGCHGWYLLWVQTNGVPELGLYGVRWESTGA
jgi:hypothetical protein